jgi:hypothetical protein
MGWMENTEPGDFDDVESNGPVRYNAWGLYDSLPSNNKNLPRKDPRTQY